MWSLTIQSPFGTDESTLSSKLDVSPPPWPEPVRRGWARMPVHATYGLPVLLELHVVRLEENIAEKISRLNRTRAARDAYDLAWLVTHQRDIGAMAVPTPTLADLNATIQAHYGFPRELDTEGGSSPPHENKSATSPCGYSTGCPERASPRLLSTN